MLEVLVAVLDHMVEMEVVTVNSETARDPDGRPAAPSPTVGCVWRAQKRANRSSAPRPPGELSLVTAKEISVPSAPAEKDKLTDMQGVRF